MGEIRLVLARVAARCAAASLTLFANCCLAFLASEYLTYFISQ